MAGAAAKEVFSRVVNNEGMVRANSIQNINGQIILGAVGGDTYNSGTLDASQVAENGNGGEVLIGGDFQGNNPEVQNAKRTFVDSDAEIKANAGATGDGGKIIVWADEVTGFNGSASARGGDTSGDGGFIEISGKGRLAYSGSVDATTTNGELGNVLFDPTDLDVDATGTDGLTAGDDVLFGDAGGEPWSVSAAQLNAAGGDVILQAENDINIDAAINLGTANASLTIQAGDNLNVNTGNTIQTNGGDIHLEANSPHATGGADGTGTLTINATVTSNGGNITLIGEDDVITATVNAGGGNINLVELGGGATIAMDLGDTNDLTDTEFDFLQSTGGVITIGQATSAGSDGAGTGAQTITATTIDFNASSAFSAVGTAAGEYVFIANDGVILNDSATFAQNVTINADANADGTGTFEVSDGDTISSGGNALNITAADIALNTSGAINSGAGDTSITASNNRPIVLGGGGAGTDLIISDAELDNITTTGLTLTSAAGITVNGVTAGSTNQISGTTVLDAGSDITFATGASTFTNVLTAKADNDINANIALTVNTGTLTLKADNDDGNNTGAITGAGVLTATTIDLDAATGISSSTSATTVSADNTTSGNVSVSDAGSVTISGSNAGGGTFTAIAGGAGNTLTVAGTNIAAGTGTVTLEADEMTLTGTVTANGGVTLRTNTAIAINVENGTGGLDFTDADLNKIFTTGTLTLGGVNETGITVGSGNAVDLTTHVNHLTLDTNTGVITLANASITTDGDQTYSDAVELDSGTVTLSTGTGTGDIVFSSTLDGADTTARDLSLTAADGSITFSNQVGNTDELGAVSIASALNVNVNNTFDAASLVQTTGSGTTTLTNDINTTAAAGVNISNTNIVLDGLTITTTNSGVARFDGATNLTTGTADIDADGTITFTGALTATGAQALTLESDVNIDFDSTVGSGASNELGAILINDAVDVTADNTVEAASISQVAGTGTTTFSGTVDTSAGTGLDLNGTAFTFSDTVTTTGNGTVTITCSGLLTISNGADFNLTGAFDQDGSGAVSLGDDIVTTDDAITFDGSVTLTQSIILNTDTGAGDVTFNGTLIGAADLTQDLTISAGTGLVRNRSG